MIESIQHTSDFRTTELGPQQTIAFQNGHSSLSSAAKKKESCLLRYLKTIGTSLAGICLAIYELLMTIICCRSVAPQKQENLLQFARLPQESTRRKTDPLTGSFLKLIFTSQQKTALCTILTILSNDSLPDLIFQTGKLEKLGDAVRGAHPLRQLHFIFSEKKLRDAFYKIYTRSKGFGMGRIWSQYMNDMGRDLSLCKTKGTIQPYQAAFCTLMNISIEKFNEYASSNAWEKLVLYLFNPEKCK